MSKTDTCTRCGRVGHTASSCRLPIADHIVEPFDGHEGMRRCSDCRQTFRCQRYIPSMRNTPQHCGRFVGAR